MSVIQKTAEGFSLLLFGWQKRVLPGVPYLKSTAIGTLSIAIERFFHRLKQYRRVAAHYDKDAVRYLGFVRFASILMAT